MTIPKYKVEVYKIRRDFEELIETIEVTFVPFPKLRLTLTAHSEIIEIVRWDNNQQVFKVYCE